jgi:hypothetical protein
MRPLLSASFALALLAAPLAAIVDRNNDGLSDVWAALYHPTQGAAVDEDSDGLTNAQEALAGTDPRDAASRFVAAPQTDTAGNLVLRWHGTWGKRYLVETSADLLTWTVFPELHIGRGEELSVVVRAAGAANEARRYWRVAVDDIDTDGDGMTNAEEIELGTDPTTAAAMPGMPRTYGAEFFVSTTGSDANSGTKAAPFLTLEKAKAAVRTRIAAGVPAGGIAVWLRGGLYERSAPLELAAADSGTSAANSVDWRAYPGEKVRLVGGKRIPASAFSLVTSASPVWSRLDATARGKVLQIDLKPSLGITSTSTAADKEKAYGVLRQRGFGKTERASLELFIDAEPMWLARYPDVDADVPPQSITGNTYTLHGVATPDAAGVYTKYKVEGGVSAYKRTVDGKEFMLHRTEARSVTTGEAGWRWYLNTASGQADPVWWSDIKAPGDVPKHFYGNDKTTGQLSGLDPAQPFHGYLHTTMPAAAGKFTYPGARPSRWTSAPDPWVDGFWGCEWEEQHYPAVIDTAARTLTLKGGAAVKIQPFQPWFAYNLLEEITQPGEWYLDRADGILYLWPPAGFHAGSEVVVSMLEAPLVNLTKADFVAFRELTFEASRFRLLNARGCRGIVADRLTLRNSGGSSAEFMAYGARGAADFRDNTATRLSRCVIVNSGHAAVWLEGGDRKSLTPSGNVIEDCDISRYGRFQASGVHGVYIEGCGATVRHNRIHDAPDRAIGYGGNDHLIELNELDHLCLLCADAAAIYTGHWSTRGCLVKNNFIHHVRSAINGSQTHGLYIDECGHGAWSAGNIFYEVAGAAHKFGGRDITVVNNLIVKCGSGLWVDDWGLARANPVLPPGDENQKPTYADALTDPNYGLLALGYRQEPWLSRYPECAVIPNTWEAIIADADTWLTPRNCTFTRNVVWRESPGFIFRFDKAKQYLNDGEDLEKNNLRGQDPLFVDEANLDLNLRTGSPARGLPGWQDIPFDRIGVRE